MIICRQQFLPSKSNIQIFRNYIVVGKLCLGIFFSFWNKIKHLLFTFGNSGHMKLSFKINQKFVLTINLFSVVNRFTNKLYADMKNNVIFKIKRGGIHVVIFASNSWQLEWYIGKYSERKLCIFFKINPINAHFHNKLIDYSEICRSKKLSFAATQEHLTIKPYDYNIIWFRD